MARMFPDPIPDFMDADESRGAELAVYDALRSSLSDQYRVFYGVSWLAPARSGGKPHDGEADFLIVHPEMGILVLEVKGGAISHDGVSGRWTSLNRLGTEYEIQDPVEQARRSKYALRDKLNSMAAWNRRDVTMGHGVVFPDSSGTGVALPVDLPREIMAASEDMEKLGERVGGMFRYWRGMEAPMRPIEASMMPSLERVFGRQLSLRQRLVSSVREDEKRILKLTEEQFSVLDLLARSRRVGVSGGAGTGKTLLALEKARRLANEGFRTLLTCYNQPLGEHLKASAEYSADLVVGSFHDVCRLYASKAGIKLPGFTGKSSQEFFSTTLPGAFVESMERLRAERFDAIVVDEGQDFLDEWWTALELALRDSEHGIFYVFYDDNQRLYPRKSAFPESLSPISLTTNLRNTKKIHSLATRFSGDRDLVAGGPDGRPIKLVVADESSLVAELGRVLHLLIHDDGIPPCDIAILTGRGRESNSLTDVEQIGAWRLTNDQALEPSAVLLDSIYRFKGLERPVVILVEIDDRLGKDDLMYVGVTRARSHLVIVGSEATIAALEGGRG